MAIGDDFSVAASGDIRYTGSTANYTVIDFHRWLGDLMDDALASGNDVLDITRATASERATDNLVTLIAPYNIDDTAAQHLYDGSIVQDNGNTIYDGLVCIAPAGTYVNIVQNGALVTPNFWTTGLNADAANGISHKFMLKVRTGGADIDGRRFIGQTREYGFQYSEFKVNGSARGNNVLALSASTDLNNATAVGTVAGWTTITNTTEGYKLLDVDIDTILEPYYSEWNKATFSINDFYERMKWLSRRGSASTIYGLNGELFRGPTHEIVIDTPTGTFAASESVSWTGGTGQMLAIDSVTAGTKMWIQLLTGVAPTDGQVITGASTATATVNVTVSERPLSFPFCGASTGSALIGAYGFGMETSDLSASDKLTDLNASLHLPPNNVTFTVSGLVSGEDRLLVTPLAYTFAYDNETSGPFVLDELLTFTSPAATATLINLVDNGSTGYMTVRMVSGTVPTNNSTIAGATATADVNGTVSPTIDIRQRILATTLSGAAETAVVVTVPISTDTPATGTIRIVTNAGFHRDVAYTSYTGSTYTIGSTNFTGDNATSGNNVYTAYIDKLAAASSEAFTVVFLSTRSLFIRVRDGAGTPIKTFETTGSLGAAGGSTTAIRTSDV